MILFLILSIVLNVFLGMLVFILFHLTSAYLVSAVNHARLIKAIEDAGVKDQINAALIK